MISLCISEDTNMYYIPKCICIHIDLSQHWDRKIEDCSNKTILQSIQPELPQTSIT